MTRASDGRTEDPTGTRCDDEGQGFIDAAEALGQEIVAATGRARDGSIYWRGPAEVSGAIGLAPLGATLYPGTPGVALFLAALERTLGGGHYGALCQAGLQPLRREIARLTGSPDAGSRVQHGIGGLSGLGSIVYALVRIGDLLEDDSLYEDAHGLSSLLTPARIEADESADIMLGGAGALLALLALAQRVPGPNPAGHTAMELAVSCGRHLVTRVRAYPEAAPGPGAASAPMGGFCHGAAGIAHALLGLYRHTEDPSFARAATVAGDYERSLFDPERRDWGVWSGGERRFFNSWCKGAPGVLIARSGAVGVIDPPWLGPDIEAASARTCAGELNELDDVCCGTMGRVDALVYAHQRLGESGLWRAARDLAGRVMSRAEHSQTLSFHPTFQGLFDPRFFPGTSGVGYALLRVGGGSELPCVLAME
ncbi:lanthionine synthetase LanC family protein [Haliangium sp.]|uniref:lanthionine synthetase LanC family protein n=1 Tax=Haliangium sp. TaxID=2663208 RepID=UPI003D14D549